MNNSIIINNELYKNSELLVNISSNMIRYGIGVFEAPKIVNINEKYYLFSFELYYSRLIKSCQSLNIKFRYSYFEIVDQIKKLIQNHTLSDNSALRINVFSLECSELLEEVEGDVIISILDTNHRNDANLIEKIIRIGSFERIKGHSIYKIKSPANYETSRVELFGDNDVDDVLYTNNNGEICELSRSNIFFIKGNIVYTPDLNSGILEGITRQHVIDICKKYKISVHVSSISRDDLSGFESSFCTGTTNGIVSIKKINDIVYNTQNRMLNFIKDLYLSEFTSTEIIKNMEKFIEL